MTTTEDLAELVAMRDSGATLDDIADALRVSRRTVARWSLHAPRDELRFVDRFDLEPAISVAGSPAALAEAAGVTTAVVGKWRVRGVDWVRADQVAVALGLHPGVLWSEWWAVAS